MPFTVHTYDQRNNYVVAIDIPDSTTTSDFRNVMKSTFQVDPAGHRLYYIASNGMFEEIDEYEAIRSKVWKSEPLYLAWRTQAQAMEENRRGQDKILNPLFQTLFWH
ncbi:hypothetical protein IWW55_000015 [Coemansia sp. RSA 2706]|nr:hypothetical protein LPJ63_001596 [Coemansia sp. RSA 2711]KAJ1850062.1 hypothetical protein LPJ70_000062 [Coemansia sp. RSA 2708]KAJ2309044.1 hypothetical protein IWW55_000015 [Coemansia sp. RSA 2706]KAJ2315773.1 hypothetical protein IWW54_000014 [Coemansia sp. RSA 2705]KAJ2322479.1 hypothetical protein IWW52_000014 [Coemansia sp. RSA 2704]KAJ2393550.1 hypothetical protein H4S02_000141 [Coemansia sp. RSA 2611]KAJ2740034.1 hypothetical protein H4R23_000028 [Coemansia sp. Cherry 401B]